MRRLIVATFMILTVSTPSWAAWNPEPNLCLPICTDPAEQTAPAVMSDGNKGAYIAWADNRSGDGIYMQHLDRDGNPLWATNGLLAVSGATGDQLTLVPDGAGGFLIIWFDARSHFGRILYGQRVNGAGVPQWASTGVALTGGGSTSLHIVRLGLRVVADGLGGVIACWEEYTVDRFGAESNIVARVQRADGAGVRLWGTSGILMSSLTGNQENPDLISDGAGGAIIAWDEIRSSIRRVFAQRVSSAGVPQWTTNGNSVDTNALDPSVVSDGSGGVIIAFQTTTDNISARHLNASGTNLWAPSVVVCNASGVQNFPVIVTDMAGGALIAWNDNRSGIMHLYMQRVSSSAIPQWTANGVDVSYTPSANEPAWMVSNTVGGATVIWTDYRINQSYDIRGAGVDNTGHPWMTSNSGVCTAGDTQNFQALAPDGRGGGIAVWKDWRTGSADIYAQRIESYGYTGDPSPQITAIEDIPGDQGRKVKVSWTASYVDNEWTPSTFTYTVYLQSGLDLEAVRTQIAGPLPEYSVVVPTYADSGEANGLSVFRVEARMVQGLAPTWFSPPDSGYSVDNVVPDAPNGFKGSYANGITSLEWTLGTDVDLAGYHVYRGTVAEFATGPKSLIAETRTPGYTDAAGAPFAYRVTAIDRNGNESPSVGWVPAGYVPADVGPVARLDVPRPNPALQSAALQFVLAQQATVHLTVCDIAGRIVRDLSLEHMEPGEHRLDWDLRNAAGGRVAPGTYFIRLQAAGQPILTRPLVVVR